MSENKLGYKELDEAVVLLLSLGQALAETFEDGEFNIGDVGNFLDPAMKVPAAIEGYQDIKDEAFNLTDEKIDELKLKWKEEFNLDDDELEEIIEDALVLAVRFPRLISKLVKFINREK